MTGRPPSVVPGALAGLALMIVATLAVLAEGRAGSEADLHDGGAWLLNRSAGALGHVNRAVGEVSAVVGPFAGRYDVDQAPSVVVVNNRGAGQAVLIDTNLAQPGATMTVPETTEVHAAPDAVVMIDDTIGSVWRFDREEFAGQPTLDGQQPMLSGGPGARTAVGRDGTIALAAPGTGSVTVVGPDGEEEKVDVEELASSSVVDITVVGTAAVALLDDGRLVVADGGDHEVLTPVHPVAKLQQPAMAGGSVTWIDESSGVVEFDFDAGSETVVERLDGEDPLAPIVHAGCVWAVTLAPTPAYQFCGRRHELPGVGSELKLSLVNDWVWLNDVDLGSIWLVREDDLEIEELSDWSAALNSQDDADDEDTGEGEEEQIRDQTAEKISPEVGGVDDDDRNDPPRAVDDQAATRRGRTVVVDVLANDHDADRDPLVVSELLGVDGTGRTPEGALVTVDPAGHSVQVTPPEDFTGTITFRYEVSDGRGGTDDAQVTVSVKPLDPDTNRPPEPAPDVATVRAGRSVALNLLTNDHDPDGDALTLISVEGGDGNITFAPDGEVSYTPDVTSPDGEIELTYVVADELGAEAEGTARIVVRQADSNQPPQARHDISRTAVGRPVILSVLDNDMDPDGDPLVAQNLQAVTGDIAAAQLSPDGRFLYNPESVGTHTFTYTVSDGPDVATAQIRIEVTDSTVNRPPIAVADEIALAVGENRLIRVLDNDGDPDGDVVGITDWFGAEGLVITEVPGVGFDVRPEPGVDRFVSFRYWISDGISEPVRGDVHVSTLDRSPVDYRPVARPDSVDVRAGQTTELAVLRNDYDPEGKPLRLVGPLPDLPEGLLRISVDEQVLLLSVDPAQEFGFQFGYDIEDPSGNRDTAVVNVRVVAADRPNRSPIAGPDVARTTAGNPVSVPVMANDIDPDGDPITVEGIARQPANGTVTVNDDGTVTYRPANGFAGTDSFQYVLVDGFNSPTVGVSPDGGGAGSGPGRDLGEVLVGVMAPHPENRDPVAVDDNRFPDLKLGSRAVLLDVLANDSDPDGDPLIVTEVGAATRGRVSVGADGVDFVPPDGGGAGSVSFSYRVSDGRGGAAAAVVTLNLVDDTDPRPPVAVDDTIGPAKAGSVVRFDPRRNDLDPDGDPATLTVLADSPQLTATAAGVEVTVPAATTDIVYRVRDVQGQESEPAFITVLVQENEPPVIEPLLVETGFNEPLEIDIHDQVVDPDGDPLVLTLGRQRRGGAVQVVGQPDDGFLRVRFTPDTDFVGTGVFDYTVDDGNGHNLTGQVSVTVLPSANRPPELRPVSVDLDAGVQEIVRLADFVTDPDPDGAASHRFEVGGVSGPISLGAASAAGEVRIDSDVSDGGNPASFEYTVIDGDHRVTETVSVTLNVPDFPPPVAVADTARILQGRSTGPIPVLANDADNSPVGLGGDGLTLVSVGVTGDGQTRMDGDRVVFEPDPDFFGTTSFTYAVQDGRRSAEGETIGTVTVDVVGLPDTPQPPTIDSVGNGYLIVGWDAPQSATARAPVTGYVLRFTASNGDSGSLRIDNPSTGYRWQGLRNGVRYCFSVAAVNEAGDGEFSPSPGGAECGIPDVRPERPEAPVVDFANGELDLTWSTPPNQGTRVKNYQVRISGGKQGLSAELGDVLTHTWPNLTNGTDYTFEVRAQNNAVENNGWSDWSPLSSPEHPLTVPSAPAKPTAERGDQQVMITWTAPNNGGDPISRYEVQSSLNAGWVAVTPQGITNRHTWRNIPNGTDVSFRVRAVNRDPSSTTPGNISPDSDVVRTCAVPAAPAAPAVAPGDRKVTVSWTKPPDRGCVVTGYRITNSDGVTRNVAATPLTHVFDGLANGQTYTFKVAAVNDVVTSDGQSPVFGPDSIGVTPFGPPKVSNVTEATNVGVKQVRVTWSAADPNGSPVTGYQLSVNGGSWIDVGNVISVTRTEATNGARYTYRARAFNAAGPSVELGATKTVTTWDVPGAPSVSASASSPPQVRATWSPPSNTGGTNLTGHQATLITGSSCGSGSARSNPGSPETWSGLAEGTTYRVCVRYQNQVGWGPWGSSGPVTTPVSCAPFTVWGQSFDTNLPGASIRDRPYMTANRIGSIGPGATRTAVAWTDSGSTAYPGNPSPYNEGIWYQLQGGGWAIIAGLRGPDHNDMNPSNAPPRSAACRVPPP